MIKINRLTDYATLIICEMVNDQSNIISAKHLSKKTKIGESTVSKILKMLERSGLLKSYRGTAGGYRLEKNASEIGVLDIIIAVEGDISLTLCGMNSHNACEYNTGCKVKHGWGKLNNLFMQALQSFAIKDFIDDNTNFQLKKVGKTS
jgi:FeS assembly SUF system regulator